MVVGDTVFAASENNYSAGYRINLSDIMDMVVRDSDTKGLVGGLISILFFS